MLDPNVCERAKAKRVTLAPSATNVIWTNPEECHALHPQVTAMAGSEYQSWEEVDQASQRLQR